LLLPATRGSWHFLVSSCIIPVSVSIVTRWLRSRSFGRVSLKWDPNLITPAKFVLACEVKKSQDQDIYILGGHYSAWHTTLFLLTRRFFSWASSGGPYVLS
jgi:hypothetical protein